MAGGETIDILLVDDEPLVRQVLRRVLEAEGYRVTEANSAADARRAVLAAERAFDLILLDQTMPLESGIDAAPGLRSMCPAPIILFTGHAALHSPHITAVLEKPAPIEDVLALVRLVLESSPAEPALLLGYPGDERKP
ncbi:MAG: response regulator [Myxococcales bacterium]|nr:response regulator [Myxococcales bacterium]